MYFYHEISFFGKNRHWKLVKIEEVELGKRSIGKIEGAGQIDINTLISNALILYNL